MPGGLLLQRRKQSRNMEAIPQDEDLLLFCKGLQSKAPFQDGMEVGREGKKCCLKYKETPTILFPENPRKGKNASPYLFLGDL